MSAPRGRGRGRGARAAREQAEAANLASSPSSSSTPQASTSGADDVVMQDADEASAPPTASGSGLTGPAGRRLGTTMAGLTGRDRPVGGLLGASEYTKKSSSKLKFVPNMKRKARAIVDDDEDEQEDIKPDISPVRSMGRGRGRGERKEIEMTATGPMAQGPGGNPNLSKARGVGTRGIGVMNRVNGPSGGGGGGGGGSSSGPSNSRGARGQFDHALEDPDLSESEEEDDEDDDTYRVRARNLNDIGREEDMAPLVLPRDPKITELAKERKRERTLARQKSEAKPDVDTKEFTPITIDSTTASASATPAPPELATPGAVDKKDDKDLIQAMQEVELKPELDVHQDFNLEDASKEQLYIFQFPRKFPNVINALNSSGPSIAPDGMEIKPESSLASGSGDTKPNVGRRKDPPEWGRAGPRGNKAARWPMEEGQIGELRIHKSGRVSLVINNDLEYDVLPAAQPTFLQEVVILDHDPSHIPHPPSVPTPPSDPNRAVLTMGQTSKKFLVVPEVEHLLEKIEEQEKEERRREKEREKEKEKEAKAGRKGVKKEK